MFPFDDHHRFHRPAALVANAFGGKYDKALEFLSPEPRPLGVSEADWNTIRAFRSIGVSPRQGQEG